MVNNFNTTALGEILINDHKITASDVDKILAVQKEKGLLFGEAAKSLKLINDEDLLKALSRQYEYSYLSEKDDIVDAALDAAYRPFSAQVEALRAVREQLVMRWFEHNKALAIVGIDADEERSLFIANLAIVFSQLGKKTLLIDSKLRKPTLNKLFKINNKLGVANLLSSRAEGKEILQPAPGFNNLTLLPAGAPPPNPSELITHGFKNLLLQYENQFDVILIDTDSSTLIMDAKIVAINCGAALLVAKQNESPMYKIDAFKKDISELGCKLLGAILT